jgi:transcriptional regulator with XRE-family HTH domain
MLTQLKVFRMSKGITMSQVALNAEISVSFLSRIESGKLRGTRNTRRKIAKALGATEELLFGSKQSS